MNFLNFPSFKIFPISLEDSGGPLNEWYFTSEGKKYFELIANKSFEIYCDTKTPGVYTTQIYP